jgi:hypothetical protein
MLLWVIVGMDCLFGAGQMKQQAIDARGARQNPGAVSGARAGRTAEWTVTARSQSFGGAGDGMGKEGEAID